MAPGRAPATYVVARHFLTHPDDGISRIAAHCRLASSSVSQAVKSLQQRTALLPAQLLHAAKTARERPFHQELHFQVQNPDQWLASYTGPRWISGEYAAAAEQMDLVPERLLVYLENDDFADAVAAVREIFGKVAPPSRSNLILRVSDPWLYLDPDSDFVERGQRLIDYAESRHIQILRSLPSA